MLAVTDLSARLLFEKALLAQGFVVEQIRNLPASGAFLHSAAADELQTEELDLKDRDHQKK